MVKYQVCIREEDEEAEIDDTPKYNSYEEAKSHVKQDVKDEREYQKKEYGCVSFDVHIIEINENHQITDDWFIKTVRK